MEIKNEEGIKQVKIVQILSPIDNSSFQGRMLGLGDDGVVYWSTYFGGTSGWDVYVEDNYIGDI